MGKAQKRTFKEQRYNPLGAPVVQGAATTVQSKDEVPALLKKLSSADANDRVWAAASASNLLVSEDQAVRRMLLANNVISSLIERLSDSVPDVVVQITGALYNIAAIDQGAAEEICRKNIFSAIQSLVPRLAKSIDEIIKQEKGHEKNADGAERRLVFVTADNLISILWVLCETVPSSVRQINDMALTPFLVSFFGVADRLPPSLVQTAGQFLYTLTDSTFYARRTLFGQDGAIKTLMGVVQTQQGSPSISADDFAIIRILAGGILANVKPVALSSLTKKYKDNLDGIPANETKPWEDLSGTLIQVIAQFISFDIHAAATQAIASLKATVAARTKTMSDGAETISGEASDEYLTMGRLNSQMNYVQMALELAANIFTDEGASDADAEPEESNARDKSTTGGSDDEDGGEMDGASVDGDGDDDEYEDAEDAEDAGFDQDDMNDVLADEGTVAKSTEQAIQGSILGVFINSIVPSLQRLAEPTKMTTVATALTECLVSAESSHAKMVISAVEDFVALEERALGCFNNFFLVIEESLKSWFHLHMESVNSWWSFLMAVAEHIYGKDAAPKEHLQVDKRLRFAVLEPAFGCMWTLARCVGGCVPVTPEQIKGLIHVYEAAPSAETRVKVVGALGHIARRQPGHIEENQHIGTYLLEQVVSRPLMAYAGPGDNSMPADVDAEPVVEALDIMFDIYSDMDFDYDEPVFVRGGFLGKLRKLYLPMRKMAKAVDRRKERELRDRSDLVVQNLRAFVEYKASERQ
ncbi:hypothetical protein IW140_003550 [Coemansia sp. RSA 1813]|nr:hypothetical protein EV178_003483 [Coemansia sp. RSA 1646]KAJ1769155.1 hypothetical protein LPJ74_004271 [Coemansia sp. RSA 1843]KAJ2089140.1 hypothetical protein IW138_003720 [Coemansia sp. RSA 986]KAJ2215603.1 hypothetical protein EV179_002014 [Coemansia sp. RSA 487]KAJ2568793.1 hypothetical protein IW140_003550 [Coemansia sp. RSA 1813]